MYIIFVNRVFVTKTKNSQLLIYKIFTVLILRVSAQVKI